MTAPVDVARLRRLLAEATPGPWRVDKEGPDTLILADDIPLFDWPAYGGDEWIALTPADAALIVAMHEALPALLDEVEALRRTIDVMNHPNYGEIRALAAEPNNSNLITAEDVRKRLGLGVREPQTIPPRLGTETDDPFTTIRKGAGPG